MTSKKKCIQYTESVNVNDSHVDSKVETFIIFFCAQNPEIEVRPTHLKNLL